MAMDAKTLAVLNEHLGWQSAIARQKATVAQRERELAEAVERLGDLRSKADETEYEFRAAIYEYARGIV